MDIKKFADWVQTEYGFNCFENELFEKALNSAKKEFENSTFNDVPFVIHYADNLNQQFLKRYQSRLKLLLSSIPKEDSSVSLTIEGIHLNAYSNHIDELQFSIQKLES